MPPTDAPGLDVSALTAAFHHEIAALAARDRDLAARTLERVRPPNWTLEWQLPSWLGQALEVPSPIVARAGVSNLLGLVAVRLADDADDDELAGVDAATARRLSGTLLEGAIAIYRPMLDPESAFWRDLDRILEAWRGSRTSQGSDSSANDDARLAARGAPLKAGARALTLLGDRPEAWPAVERCLDAALTALARYDDACDWERDLDAGRWNAFVAGLAPGSDGVAGGIDDRRRTRSRVLLALLNDDAASTAFGRVAIEARRAVELAASFGCGPLADHLSTVAANAEIEGAEVQAHYHVAATRMRQLLFEPVVAGGTRA